MQLGFAELLARPCGRRASRGRFATAAPAHTRGERPREAHIRGSLRSQGLIYVARFARWVAGGQHLLEDKSISPQYKHPSQHVTARARASLGSRISGFRRSAFVRHQYKHPSQHVTARARASLGSRREQVITASEVKQPRIEAKTTLF